jgi:hypothetical protein
VCLSGQLANAESLNDSRESVTLGGPNDVNQLEVRENLIDSDFLLEQSLGEIDFVADVAAVDLDFEDMSLFGASAKQLGLSVADDPDD